MSNVYVIGRNHVEKAAGQHVVESDNTRTQLPLVPISILGLSQMDRILMVM